MVVEIHFHFSAYQISNKPPQAKRALQFQTAKGIIVQEHHSHKARSSFLPKPSTGLATSRHSFVPALRRLRSIEIQQQGHVEPEVDFRVTSCPRGHRAVQRCSLRHSVNRASTRQNGASGRDPRSRMRRPVRALLRRGGPLRQTRHDVWLVAAGCLEHYYPVLTAADRMSDNCRATADCTGAV